MARLPSFMLGDFSNGDQRTMPQSIPPGTWTNGEIVVCDRGTIALLTKCQRPRWWCWWFVLANVDAQGGIYRRRSPLLAGRSSVIPMVTNCVPGLQPIRFGSLTASVKGFLGTDLDPANGDIMADFSSRGPNNTFDVLKPNVTAQALPLAAVADGGVGHQKALRNTITCKICIDVNPCSRCGALWLVHPDWTPHPIKSAIMMSAVDATVVKETDQHRPMRLIKALVAYVLTRQPSV